MLPLEGGGIDLTPSVPLSVSERGKRNPGGTPGPPAGRVPGTLFHSEAHGREGPLPPRAIGALPKRASGAPRLPQTPARPGPFHGSGKREDRGAPPEPRPGGFPAPSFTRKPTGGKVPCPRGPSGPYQRGFPAPPAFRKPPQGRGTFHGEGEGIISPSLRGKGPGVRFPPPPGSSGCGRGR